jgi:hypothetical protein
MKKIMRIGWKPALLLVSLTCFFTVGVIGFAKATPAEGANKLKLKAVMEKVKKGVPTEAPNEYGIVQIIGDVLAVAEINQGGEGIGEAFIKVNNKAEIGDEYIVCLMPGDLTEVFSLAFSKGMPLHVWAVKFFKPSEYAGLPVSGYLVAGARVVRPDIPPHLANIGIPYGLM